MGTCYTFYRIKSLHFPGALNCFQHKDRSSFASRQACHVKGKKADGFLCKLDNLQPIILKVVMKYCKEGMSPGDCPGICFKSLINFPHLLGLV